MKVVIKKWGNSAGVRIPAAIMKEASLAIDQELDVRTEKGMVIIEPVKSDELILSDLVSKITEDNIHDDIDDIDFGEAVGNEIEL